MFKRNKICTAALAALGGTLLVTSLPVLAQGQTVEVTGSRIKRIDAETALPVVTIKAADLERAGVQTAEAAMQFIAQNQSTVNSSRSIGTTNGGAAYADLRDPVRYEALARFGGVAVDALSIATSPIPAWLLATDTFAIWADELDEPGLLSTALLGATTRDTFFAQLLDRIAANGQLEGGDPRFLVGCADPQPIEDALRQQPCRARRRGCRPR